MESTSIAARSDHAIEAKWILHVRWRSFFSDLLHGVAPDELGLNWPLLMRMPEHCEEMEQLCMVRDCPDGVL